MSLDASYLKDYERRLADRVAVEARQFACALPPAADATDGAYRAGWTNEIVRALARHDLMRVAALALGAEMSLAHRAARRRKRERP
jgi:hypothetical protein